MSAPIDYAGVRSAIETILQGAAAEGGTLEGSRVFIEEEPQFGLPDEGVGIAVFMDSRVANDEKQFMSAGKRTRYDLRLSFWVIAFNMGNYRQACDDRDRILGALELVLMANRTLGDTVESSKLEGGEMFSARNAQNSVYTAAAEVVLTVQVSAINA